MKYIKKHFETFDFLVKMKPVSNAGTRKSYKVNLVTVRGGTTV